MKFNKGVFLLVILSIFLFSCSKEKSYEMTDPNSGVYLPHTTDATWHYEDTVQQTGFTLKATNRIDSIDKIRFYLYENIPDDPALDTSITLIGHAGYNYYISGFLPQLGGEKLLVLKQDAVVGETWHQKVALTESDSVELVFQIKEKGISHVVFGKNYNQVIHVGILAKMPFGIETGGGSEIGTTIEVPLGDLYYAKGVGIIELQLDFQGQMPSVHLLLTNYTIP